VLTPRSGLTRRVLAVLDASPSRIPVIVGGCGSGRTTLLQQLHDWIGRTQSQYINVERTASTPELFLRAILAASPFPSSDPPSPGFWEADHEPVRHAELRFAHADIAQVG